MSSVISLERDQSPALCNACGIPFDSQYFDDSKVEKAPKLGEEIVLARFDLPAQSCGVLLYFAQFTDRFAVDASKIDTPQIEWQILVNNHALFPNMNLRHIVNPWGFGSYPVNIRLDENSSIEFVARRVQKETPPEDPLVVTVGGRIMGRFWYNSCYGDVERRSY
jgi:hypothetical protein